MRRRDFALAIAALPAALGPRGAQPAEEPGRRVEIAAVRFSFSPNEITARAGERLTLAIRATDFVHGFAIPDLGLRIDAQPGRTVTLALPALRAGRYAWLCDNFCGEGHETMVGTLRVEPA